MPKLKEILDYIIGGLFFAIPIVGIAIAGIYFLLTYDLIPDPSPWFENLSEEGKILACILFVLVWNGGSKKSA